MVARTTARASLAALAAIFLTLVLASQAVAAKWSAPIALSTALDSSALGIVATGPTSAAALYYNGDRVLIKRTANSGASWGAPMTLSTQDASRPQIAGVGAKVDVVWAEAEPFSYPTVRYAVSTNRARSFGPPQVLSPAAADHVATEVAVARGSDTHVAVAWTDVIDDSFDPPWTHAIRLRISTDGGASFGTVKTLASGHVQFPAVAMDGGIVHVAYEARRQLVVRSSSDFGATWSAPTILASRASWFADPGPYVVAAEGQVFVSYAALGGDYPDHWSVYRRSTDGGRSWSDPVNLTAPTAAHAYAARIAVHDGIARAVLEQDCYYRVHEPTDTCSTRVMYRRSTDGITWSAPQVVSTARTTLNRPAGIVFAGKVLVAYGGFRAEPIGYFVYVRSRTE